MTSPGFLKVPHNIVYASYSLKSDRDKLNSFCIEVLQTQFKTFLYLYHSLLCLFSQTEVVVYLLMPVVWQYNNLVF